MIVYGEFERFCIIYFESNILLLFWVENCTMFELNSSNLQRIKSFSHDNRTYTKLPPRNFLHLCFQTDSLIQFFPFVVFNWIFTNTCNNSVFFYRHNRKKTNSKQFIFKETRFLGNSREIIIILLACLFYKTVIRLKHIVYYEQIALQAFNKFSI